MTRSIEASVQLHPPTHGAARLPAPRSPTPSISHEKKTARKTALSALQACTDGWRSRPLERVRQQTAAHEQTADDSRTRTRTPRDAVVTDVFWRYGAVLNEGQRKEEHAEPRNSDANATTNMPETATP